MQVYYFISNLSEEDYGFFIDKVSQIQSEGDVDRAIHLYTHKSGGDNKNTTQRAAFVEACMFIKEFLLRGYGKVHNIHWIHKQNFISYNDSIYINVEGEWRYIDQETLFVSSRDSWKHPFFYFLLQGTFSDNIKATKPNMHDGWPYHDKLFFIQKLWGNRSKFIGDILMPFIMDNTETAVLQLLSFVSQKLGNNFIIKNNFGVEGLSVKAIDFKSMNHQGITQIRNQFFSQKKVYTFHSPYFISYYDIKKEFRLYYTYTDGDISIYSVKHKSYDTQGKDIFSLKDFSKNNLKIIWEYCGVQDFDTQYMQVRRVAEQMIQSLGLEVGVLELALLEDDSLRFIEVNSLGGTLMFAGEDEKNMKDYYSSMWDQNFSRISKSEKNKLVK